MSHIQWELKAVEKAPYVARAAECDEDIVYGGLTRLWVYCWREKALYISETELTGIFRQSSPGLLSALMAFGFLEYQEDGRYRVKGAERYLRVQDGLEKGRSKGGHASKGNLIPGAKYRKSADREPIGEPIGEPIESREPAEKSIGSSRLLTPNTDHRYSSSKEEECAAPASPAPDSYELEPVPAHTKTPKPKATAKKATPPDPRHAPLVDAFVKAFLAKRGHAYGFDRARDPPAVKALLARATPEEILRRWGIALERSGFPTVSAIHELATHWNHFATDEPRRQLDPRKGVFRAEDADYSRDQIDENGNVTNF